jgi:hypothetical protein
MHLTSFFHQLFRWLSVKLLILTLGFPSMVAGQSGVTPTNVSVEITRPWNGEGFLPEEVVPIWATVLNPSAHVLILEIYAGTNLIHSSSSPANRTEPVSHQFYWNASLGSHVITVHIKDRSGTISVSEPLHIRVTNEALPIVGVNSYFTQFEPIPYADYSRGFFLIERRQRINEPLMVFLGAGGSATADLDYARLPDRVLFRAGERQIKIPVQTFDDQIFEGDESLALEVIPPPPGTETEYPTNYLIGPSASVAIEDNENPNALPHLEIITPQHQEMLEQGSDIEFKVIARDPKGYIPRIELISQYGSRPGLLGISEKSFETPPAPGTPITHSIILSNAAPNIYAHLLLRGYNAAGIPVTTNRITILVGPNPDRVTLGVFPDWWQGNEASERLTNGLPAATSFYVHRVFGPTNQPVHYSLTIEGTAQNGIDIQPIRLTGVLEAGVGLTNIVVTPIPDDLAEDTETVVVKLVDPQCWITNSTFSITNPACYMVGTNNEVVSTIHDAPSTNVAGVVLNVEAVDEEASEAPLNGVIDTAKFRVYRVSGPIEEEVRFQIALSGEAQNGIDYELVDSMITLPAYRSFKDIFIRPKPDPEGDYDYNESVILTLIDYDCGIISTGQTLAAFSDFPSCYDVIEPRVAQAKIIMSRNGTNHPPLTMITHPHDGAVFVEGEAIEVRGEVLDLEGMLSAVHLYLEGGTNGRIFHLLKDLTPTVSGPGTNAVNAGEVQFTVTTNLPAGEHWFDVFAVDSTGMVTYSKPVRILVRPADATNIVTEIPLTLEQTRLLTDGTVRLRLKGGVGQVCRLESSSNLEDWDLVGRVYLPDGQLDYFERQPSTNRYFRLLDE